jgi:hypothetical protein
LGNKLTQYRRVSRGVRKLKDVSLYLISDQSEIFDNKDIQKIKLYIY